MGISIDNLSEPPSKKVTLPPKPVYGEDVEKKLAQSERDRRIGNEQLETRC